jgi:hypothetical protein
MDEVKVFAPETIPETPLPTLAPVSFATSDPSTALASKPATVPDQAFPTTRIAQETITSNFNTKTRKIISEFQFTPQGALQIGLFTMGVSGDIRISPVGIVARDLAGNTTFALDGDTGDATFAGQLRSGTLVVGQIAVGDDAIQIDGINRRIIFYDTNGIPVIIIGNV